MRLVAPLTEPSGGRLSFPAPWHLLVAYLAKNDLLKVEKSQANALL
jgi:hypothetical protein